MRYFLTLAVATATLLTSPADAGLFKKHGKAKCDTCAPGCTESCNPCDYKCKRTDKLEPVEKDCALIENEAICIPPITTSPFDCFRKRTRCGGCGLLGCKGGCDGCDARTSIPMHTCDASCDGGCGQSAGRGGLLGCLNGCGKIRCVKKLGSDSYECGEKCVTEWEAVKVDCCGHELSDGESADEEAAELDLPDLQEEETKEDEAAAEKDAPPMPPIEPIKDEEDLEDAPGPPSEPDAEDAAEEAADDAKDAPKGGPVKKDAPAKLETPQAKRLYFGARKRG